MHMHLSKYVSIKFRLYMIYYVNVIKFTKERQISSSTGIVTYTFTHDFHVLIKLKFYNIRYLFIFCCIKNVFVYFCKRCVSLIFAYCTINSKLLLTRQFKLKVYSSTLHIYFIRVILSQFINFLNWMDKKISLRSLQTPKVSTLVRMTAYVFVCCLRLFN